jgi:23S rRNA pseudouridine1911/1915/1917 synthase
MVIVDWVTTAQGRIAHCRIRTEGTLLTRLAALGVSREDAEMLLYFGAVYHEGERVRSDRVLSPGDYVRIHLQPKRFPVDNVDWRSTVIHDNDQFAIVNKPAGIPVHPTVDNHVENVLHQLSLVLGSRLHVTQRLDADVGGLMVLARTREFQRYFNRLLSERAVRKRYRALVHRTPGPGRYIHYMKPEARTPKTVQAAALPGWLECALRIEDVKPLCGDHEPPIFEIEIDLETGRTHQIRAQLAALGSPVVGDKLYGSPVSHEIDTVVRPGIGLSSVAISWTGEDGRAWSFTLDGR